MSEQFTIERVGPPREWESPKYKKQYLGYPLDLKDSKGNLHLGVESNRQLKEDGSHNEPREGDVVMGTIGPDRNTGNDKLTLDYAAMKEMKQGGGREVSSSGSGDYRRNGKADQSAEIHRQVALKILAPRINKDGLTDEVKSLVQEIETFITTATAAGASRSPSAHISQAPAASQPPDAHGFSHYLEEGGVNAAAATLITNWVLSGDLEDGSLTASEQDAALDALRDPEKRSKAIERLRERYTAANGELPEAEPYDDGIPF